VRTRSRAIVKLGSSVNASKVLGHDLPDDLVVEHRIPEAIDEAGKT
jgi:hypothetical protein